MNNPKLSDSASNTATNAICTSLNNGYLRIYDGSQPASADVAVTTQTMLAELRFNATAFQSAVGGVASSNELTADNDTPASGTATWFRALASDGSTVVFDGSVGTSSADLILSSVNLASGSIVAISNITYTHNKG